MASRILLGFFTLIFVIGSHADPAAAWQFAQGSDKNPKPDDPSHSPTRAVFDCAGRDTLDLFPGLLVEIPDSTTASENLLSGYACRSWSENGPENIYRLEISQDLEVFGALRGFDDPTGLPDEDFDIFLLGDCDTDSCLAGENLEFSITLEPGTYYLVVDGYGTSNPAVGFYTLLLECRELGVPAQVCEPGGSLAINPGVTTSDHVVNLFDRPNLIQTYSCSPITERGGEVWFAVTVAAEHEFTAETIQLATSLDAALWLFDGCGTEAQCLDFADERLAGQAESLNWANESGAEQTVYLALDCYRSPDFVELGEVTLQFRGVSNVPTVKRSLGSVRGLYR